MRNRRLNETCEKLLEICCLGVGILKLENIMGTSLKESWGMSDDSEFAGCYQNFYMIDDAIEYGDDKQGIAFFQSCMEDYALYLQEHFEYVNKWRD